LKVKLARNENIFLSYGVRISITEAGSERSNGTRTSVASLIPSLIGTINGTLE
jgi:hypothetical protein